MVYPPPDYTARGKTTDAVLAMHHDTTDMWLCLSASIQLTCQSSTVREVGSHLLLLLTACRAERQKAAMASRGQQVRYDRQTAHRALHLRKCCWRRGSAGCDGGRRPLQRLALPLQAAGDGGRSFCRPWRMGTKPSAGGLGCGSAGRLQLRLRLRFHMLF